MARYTKDDNGNLILTAGGTRTWITTSSRHSTAVSEGTAPNNCLVAITDDYPAGENSEHIGTWTFTEAGSENDNTLTTYTADRDGIVSVDAVNVGSASSAGGYYYFFVGTYQVPSPLSSTNDSDWSNSEKTVSHKLIPLAEGESIRIHRQKNCTGTFAVNFL